MKKWLEVDLKFDILVLVVTITTTLLLMVDHYCTFTSVKELDRFLLYLVIPVGIIMIGFRRKPSDFGFQLGDWRAGLVITLGAIILLAPVIWLATRLSTGMQAYYQGIGFSSQLILLTALELLAWEFFFRGFMYFGYESAFGDHALWLQAVPFALAHISKPAVETFTTLFGGFLFAIVARRTRSFLYPFAIHVFVTLFTRIVALSLA